MNISIYGHSYTRIFTYAERGIYHAFQTAGGAGLLWALLNPQTEMQESKAELDCFYYELMEDAAKDSWRIARFLGRMSGGQHNERVKYTAGEHLIVWDEGWGNLKLDDDFYSTVLWASDKALPDKEEFTKVADKCFLFLSGDVLRGAGAMISRQISWERTTSELIWQLKNNPELAYLLKARQLLIPFAEDGAVHLWWQEGQLAARLVLTHGGGEGFLKEKAAGENMDAFLLMTASLAQQVPGVLNNEEKPLYILPVLQTGEEFLTKGCSPEDLERNEYTILTETEDVETVFTVPLSMEPEADKLDDWCISNNVANKRMFDIAFEFVMEGKKVIEGLPQLSFGALTTVDRWEIEAFQNIRNLIMNYAASEKVQPLSIAVFGTPGSGKSFGVTQIAKNILPDKVVKLEFNVSQFNSFADLGAAFQKVRDVILAGKLPLVFFDEFDSERDGLQLGWIKSFLMPMQDGKFKDDSGEHPLGKCILVFAGGTAGSFAEFIAPMQEGNLMEQQAFRKVKGPDFVSRLKGTINILGPNPKDELDTNYILRRALLLRSLCERKLKLDKGAVPVSKNIIWGMLLVPEYKHGARSMEAILDMSRLENNVWEPVSLPFHSQLSLHVDADAFVKLVLREVILHSYVEPLARAIHEDYRKKMLIAGNLDHPSVVEWEELTEEFRDSNRNQARSFGEALRSVGYDYDAGDTPFPSVKKFDKARELVLAQNEHLRWMREKVANGWSYGQKRDDEKKLNPLLVDWEELPPEEQQKDFDVVDNMISLLESIGLRVYKAI